LLNRLNFITYKALLSNAFTLIASSFTKLLKALNPPFNYYLSSIKNFRETNLKTI
jgi:hypothetical protein